MCKPYHENDLTIGQMIEIKETKEEKLEPTQVRTARVFPTFIIPGETKELKVGLLNRQNNDITYRISNVTLTDENKGSEIEGCNIIYDSSENIIKANSTKTIDLKIICEQTVKCQTWRISDVYGNVSEDCRLTLSVDLQFTDELGNVHKNNLFRMALSSGNKSFLSIDHSEKISSKNEFYIYADFTDNKGNKIRDAQIALEFENLGVSGIFTMRYDEKLGKYKFFWYDFVEWDPGYKKGKYSFRITAIKSGYETQFAGPYEFVLN